MPKRKLLGMKAKTFKFSSATLGIADDRMPYRCAVNTKLVCAAGYRHKLDKG